MTPPWLTVTRGDAPLIVSIPHAGTDIPAEIEARLVSPWRARKDADWWVDTLYGSAHWLGATLVQTAMSRTVIDVNRDPSGASLYPGQATTGLCPIATFDGEPLYRDGHAPDDADITRRREAFYRPYHDALQTEITRLQRANKSIVLFDAHSIRSRVPRLFDGQLPDLNLGTNGGASCSPRLTSDLETLCDASDFTRVTNGRFKGGYITRHYGAPADGVHAVQLELSMRLYMDEPETPSPDNWPQTMRFAGVPPLMDLLTRLLQACIAFATSETS